jgi:hypothetical protein
MHALEVEFIQNPKEIRKILTYETRDVVDYTGHTVLLNEIQKAVMGGSIHFAQQK